MDIIAILILGLIMLTIYVLYGVVYKDFAGKHYEMMKKHLPGKVWPKTREGYIIFYKTVIVLILLVSIGLFLYSIIDRW
jgi:hypothetical protein